MSAALSARAIVVIGRIYRDGSSRSRKRRSSPTEALRGEAAAWPGRLTLRETEVLRLVARGFSNREVAEALGTAEGTVKNQLSSVMSKLGVRDRTRAVLKALEFGYV
jgi:DNA-binding NarL/FixJ family response regulator